MSRRRHLFKRDPLPGSVLEERVNRLERAAEPPPDLPMPEFDELARFAAGQMANLPKARQQAQALLNILKIARQQAAAASGT